MCLDCIKMTTDITQGIPRDGVVHYCRGCEVLFSFKDLTNPAAILTTPQRMGECTTREQRVIGIMSKEASWSQ